MFNKVKFLLVLLVMASAGCSTHHNFSASAHTRGLKRMESVYVARAADGRYGSKVYNGSGIKTSIAFADTLKRYAGNVSIGRSEAGLSSVLSEAASHRAKYAFVPKILNWEPHSAWEFEATRLKLEVSIYDVESRKLMARKNVESIGREFTLMTQNVEDLLGDAVDGIVDGLYPY